MDTVRTCVTLYIVQHVPLLQNLIISIGQCIIVSHSDDTQVVI